MARSKTEHERTADARSAARGLVHKTTNANTQDEWREVARKAGALQRRARLLGGLSKGG